MYLLKVVKVFLLLLTFFFFSLISKIYADEYCESNDPNQVLETKFNRIYFDEANYKEAFVCSELGTALNNKVFESWLGYFYYNGQGTDLNLEKAYNHFKNASDNGDGYASWYMGLIDSHGIPEMNLKISNEKSYSYYKLSFEQNYSYAASSLARIYYFGTGTNVDYKKSFNYLNLAPESLTNFGKNLLAKHYLLGRGVKQNIKEGVRLLEEAIENNHNASLETLNMLFGNDYMNKEKRKPQSAFFYMYEREKFVNFGYKGLDYVQALSKLSREQKHLEVISLSKEIIDRYRDSINNINNPITEEVCYSINQLFFHEGQLEDPLMTDEYLFNLIELAYQNDCGDVSVSNYAWFLIWSDEYKTIKSI